ncbi:MAG: YcxB family protein [Crocinitomicaceae bacterium]
MQQITFEFTREDWIAFNIHHIYSSPQHQRIRKKAIRSFPVMAIFVVLFYGITNDEWVIPPIVCGIAVAFWFWWYPGYRDRKIMKGVERFIDNEKNKSFLGKHEVELSNKGVKLTTENSEEMIQWSGIDRMEITDEYYFIYNSALTAVIIPNIAVDNQDEFERFVEKYID